MKEKNLNDYSLGDVSRIFMENVDALIIVDAEIDQYKTVLRKGFFETFLKEGGRYHDLILDLWFHFNDSSEKVTKDYQIFADNTGVFKNKYSRRLRLMLDNEEFLIICYGKNSIEAKASAEELRRKVDDYMFPEIGHITCSVGVTEIFGGDSMTEAFNRIDKAMYASKHNGRNMVTVM
ncbi:MAG: diguanylate cyclase [Clostridiales bacterium]|nr:diguanylate cyclase [Clostridiales bacterium]